jgi:hypothetical protein
MLHRLASAPDSHISIGLTAATTITGEDIIEFIKVMFVFQNKAYVPLELLLFLMNNKLDIQARNYHN